MICQAVITNWLFCQSISDVYVFSLVDISPVLMLLSAIESSLRAVSQYWHMMTMATCVMIPSNQLVMTYLRLHLRRYSMLSSAEEGKFAVFCAKVV